MAIFQPAESTSAYLKMGIMGKQGAGKSMTSAKVTIGLIKHLKEQGVDYASKPVAFFDTETGSDWLIPVFEKAGIPLVVAKKRSFADLLEAVRWAEQNASALIIDSITHPWRELQESYMKKKQRTYLQIDDWGYLKGDHGWAQFTDLYINSKLHIIMAGRAGDDTEQYTDENGKRQFEKVGVKMKTEGETGFEPSLLVLMEREMNLRTNAVTHRAYVLKDRSTMLDGAEIDDPDFKDFFPHINRLNLGGAHVGVQVGRDSQGILKTEKRDWQPVQRKIVLGELQDLLVQHAGGQAIADKQRRISLLKTHFAGCGYVEIEETMPLVDLRAGYDSLHRELEGKPSKYASAMEADLRSNDMNDSLPDFVALKDVTPSPELLASKLVVEGAAALAVAATVDTAALADNGMPAFLDRREQPAVTVSPAEPTFDEARWLADLTKQFDACGDFGAFGQIQTAIMNSAKAKATAATWAKALKLAKRCSARLLEPEPALVAAE